MLITIFSNVPYKYRQKNKFNFKKFRLKNDASLLNLQPNDSVTDIPGPSAGCKGTGDFTHLFGDNL